MRGRVMLASGHQRAPDAAPAVARIDRDRIEARRRGPLAQRDQRIAGQTLVCDGDDQRAMRAEDEGAQGAARQAVGGEDGELQRQNGVEVAEFGRADVKLCSYRLDAFGRKTKAARMFHTEAAGGSACAGAHGAN